jgi:hypothetical protein
MATIGGRYEFHRSCPSQEMDIVEVSSTGAFIEANLDGRTLTGQYDASTNRITFNDARFPGQTLFVSFYTGYVMPTEEGGVCAMAGTFTEQEILVETGALAARIAPGGGGIFPTETFHGGWYAVWIGDIIT